MEIPSYVKEADRIAMNEAVRDYAYENYCKGVMLAVAALREGIAGGYRPEHDELVEMCDHLEAKAREPRNPSTR